MPKQENQEENLESTTPVEVLEDLMEEEEESTPKKQKKKNKKEHFKKIKTWWKNMTKKKKIACISLLFLTVVFLSIVIYFFVKKTEDPEETQNPVQEDVIVELENYRYKSGTLLFLDEKEEVLGSYTCENQDEDLCYVPYYSTEDDFDNVEKQYEDGSKVQERTPIINNRFVFISDHKKNSEEIIKLYNIEKGEMLEGNYRLVKKGNTATNFIVKDTASNYGVISLENEPKTLIPFSYDYLGYLETAETNFISLQKNRTVIIDENGKNISKSIPGTVKEVTPKYITTVDDYGVYSVYDYNAVEVFTGYDYIELYSDYAALILDKKLTLQFYDKTKMLEEAIPLMNTDYRKTNIYDAENKLKETKESFTLEEKNNIITIQVKTRETQKFTTINKLEALNNKNIKYINYFDGKLYVYRDVEKTDLIGFYSCSNKNNITKESMDLTNCTLASDTIFENNEVETPGVSGFIPIFNERFIFISDNPALVNDTNRTVVLYDLKNKKAISKYNAVNTYSYTGTKEVSFNATIDLQVVAKNKSNKFGVIKIGLSEISAYIPFNYTSLEKLGDYYLAENGVYTLLNRSNGLASSFAPVSGKIRNYNDEYITVFENNSYFVYNEKGEKITNEEYVYIELFPTFFAAVDKNNKLSLHLYEKPGVNFLSEEIPLNLNTYYGSGTLAYRITLSGNQYTVLVGTKSDIYVPSATGKIPTKEELENLDKEANAVDNREEENTGEET